MQPSWATVRDLFEQRVHPCKYIPKRLTRHLREPLDDPLFEFDHPFSLPQLIGERDQPILAGEIVAVPLCMGDTKPSKIAEASDEFRGRLGDELMVANEVGRGTEGT